MTVYNSVYMLITNNQYFDIYVTIYTQYVTMCYMDIQTILGLLAFTLSLIVIFPLLTNHLPNVT